MRKRHPNVVNATLSTIDPRAVKILNHDNEVTCSYTVKKYMRMAKKRQPPPVLAIQKKTGIILLDGFHRMHAAQKRRAKKIKAWLVPWAKVSHLWPSKNDYHDDLVILDEHILCDGKPYWELRC